MKKKFGFTLAETLIFMAIVGIITIVGLSTFQNFDKGIRYIYSNTYHALDRALFNSTNFSELNDPFELRNSNNVAVSANEGKTRLCNALREYINVLETHCGNAPVSLAGNVFGQPHLVAGNGVRFYISTRLHDENEEGSPVFYIIFADINGEKRPNSMRYVPGSHAHNIKTVDPDIFAFAALDIGRVCPLGIPEYDSRYMMTRISYEEMVQNQNGGEEALKRYTRNSKPYYISKAEAWGYYLTSQPILERTIIEDEPYSYNGYIRNYLNIASPGNQIYSFMNNAPFNGQPLRAPAEIGIRNDLNCNRATPDTDPNCQVFIDKYIY